MGLHEGRHAGAATLASRTRASVEVQQYKGQFTQLAFLDCSKCYDWVNLWTAGVRAIGSGMQGMIANLVFDLYTGGGGVYEHTAQRHNHGRQPWVVSRVCAC